MSEEVISHIAVYRCRACGTVFSYGDGLTANESYDAVDNAIEFWNDDSNDLIKKQDADSWVAKRGHHTCDNGTFAVGDFAGTRPIIEGVDEVEH